MDTAEFLFPHDLELTPSPIKRVLLIGSCLSDMYGSKFADIKPHVTFDRVLFNNAADLPSRPPVDIAEYDFQYIQIPLRSVISDGIISARNLGDARFITSLLEAAKRNLDAMLRAALSYNESTGLLTFVANFIVPQVRIAAGLFANHTESDLTHLIQELNVHLAVRIKDYTNVVYADVDAIAGSLGKKLFLDDAIYFYSHNTVVLPHWAEMEMMPTWTAPERGRIEDLPPLHTLYENRTDEFFEAVYRQAEAGYRIVHQIDMVKVVIFDLDNTLWRGQIAEHYEAGSHWPYSDGWPVGLWEAVQQLRWRGIITSIASKNDHDLVQRRWDEIVQPPFLRLTDFVHPQIGWMPKAESVGRILKAVNVTAKSAVFVDDNPVERESVRAAFPGIRAIGANPYLTRRILLWSPETQVATVTAESARRETMVRGQIDRDMEKLAMSRDGFLQTLQCRIELLEITGIGQPAFPRALELVNKTNQFNTTGERWHGASIQAFLRRGGRLITFTAADRFVEYGLVGVLFVRDDTIVQFVMSCRVLGMDIELAVVAEAVARIRAEHPGTRVRGALVQTGANGPCREVFSKAGFTPSAEPDIFELAAGAAPAPVPHVDVAWAASPETRPSDDLPAVLPGVDQPGRFPPVGEVFNGAAFFDGTGSTGDQAAGGWLIPAGRTGLNSYLRYHHPVEGTAVVAGRIARFSVTLDTSPDLAHKLRLRPDFTSTYTTLGRAGYSSNPRIVTHSATELELTWNYIFTGEETCVVAALQVVAGTPPVDEPAWTMLREQRFSLLPLAGEAEADRQHEAVA